MLVRKKKLGFATVVILTLLLAIPAAVSAAAAPAVLRTGLPNHALTPGVLNPAVTQATIGATICVSGWTTTVRPPTSYTTPLKRTQLITYGYSDRSLTNYEEDHFVPLELGGSPSSPKNLWPEPHHLILGGLDVGSYTKDGLENYLHRQVCSGHLTLAKARVLVETNWIATWKAAGKPKG